MTNEQNFFHFRRKLLELGADLDESAAKVVTQMTAVAFNRTVHDTPVGKYARGKQGGTLRRGWTKGKALKLGNGWQSEYYNNVYYAIYVNNGHRLKRDGKVIGFVPGVKMLESGMNEARRKNESIFREEISRVKRKGGW